MLKVARYGIDAPALVRTFFIAGIALAGMGALPVWGRLPAWLGWIALPLLVLALYPLGMGCYMLWGSLVTKVRGRERILNLHRWRGDEQVLDVGCGRGLLLVGAAQRLTRGGHATGIDLWLSRDQSANHADAPMRNAQHEGVADRVSVSTGDMRALPFSDASFDVVLSSWAVHNVEPAAERRRVLSEMVRVLRPDGSLLLDDITGREEYAAEMEALGLADVRVVVASAWRDRVNRLVSFGSFQPATVMGRKVS